MYFVGTKFNENKWSTEIHELDAITKFVLFQIESPNFYFNINLKTYYIANTVDK